MNHDIRPRRSALYMPATNQRAMDKARELNIDVVIFDLEDAVTPAAKLQARALACAQVRAGGYGRREVLIRVNGLDTRWGEDDLAAAVAAGPDAILVPKVHDAALAGMYVRRLRELGSRAALWVMIETPAGVANVDAIAAQDGVAVLVMGTSDLMKELRARDTSGRGALLYALSRTVNAARRYGRDVLDGVSPVLDDEPAFTALCIQGRDLGFDGKTLIHPAQVAPANRAFGPTPDEVRLAQRVVQAWDETRQAGQGIAVLDGKMVENLHAEQARRVIAFQAAIGQNG
ncbi:CoA ester lyase [Achromobacter sp. GG226]|uniref:HpcH/HpaI aldolase/citrate lyase family protein n=1 Tax=Verticiella alkaliphila TaxID=2779529 RepID=UPI00209ABCB3|nr:CoA ester lyase [Verticiella sp. GG226]MBU4611498.1 CoA ester lyase [Verticiella sp. GG226]